MQFFSHYFVFYWLMGKMELFEGHIVLEFEKVNLVHTLRLSYHYTSRLKFYDKSIQNIVRLIFLA